MISPAVAAALALARHHAAAFRARPSRFDLAPRSPAGSSTPRRRLAIGDPQAPIEVFLAILDRHGALADDGRLRADTALVSMGDHFDWGDVKDRERAATSGLELLVWLASHPPDQVTILAGNHDLARVGELAAIDDARFAEAQAEADAAYHAGLPRRSEEAFRAAFDLPWWEVASRDLGTFRVEQRDLVTALLQARRLRVAVAAAPDLLLSHAGVTVDYLAALSLPRSDAFAIAAGLDAVLDRALRAWTGGPLVIPGLHRPGDREAEGDGMLYHRPARHLPSRDFPAPRRFDARRLPRGLTQAIGHIADTKCRDLLDAPLEGARHGVLHHLLVQGDELAYAEGPPGGIEPDAAALVFLDGGMNKAPPEEYELFDLDTRAVAIAVGRA